MESKSAGTCPFEDCGEPADAAWPGEGLPVLEGVADDLHRPEQVAGLWVCDAHAGLLAAILATARRSLDAEAGAGAV
jgi:hypothetical protein